MSLRDFYRAMTVDVPEGEYDGMKIDRFTIEPGNIHAGLMALRGRGTPPGTYTRLRGDGKFWMSDTQAEKQDHIGAVMKADDLKAERILINGLGLGMVLKAFLTMDHVQHIDVVEIDERVIKLVGPHYAKDPRVNIIHANAYEQAKKWPSGTRWDVGWSDIWPDPSTDDLKEMAILNRSYGRRCTWHGCWYQDELQYQQRKDREHDRMWNY